MHRETIRQLAELEAVENATVVAAGGKLVVRMSSGDDCECSVLAGALAGRSRLESGDRVLILRSGMDDSPPCVIGVVLDYESALAEARCGSDEEPPSAAERRTIAAEEIVIEAGQRLELRVNDSTIVITKDGSIAIRGRNILSRAKELNRVKGAAVGVN